MNFLTDFIKPFKLKLALYYFSLLFYVATVFFLPIFIGSFINACISTNSLNVKYLAFLTVLCIAEFVFSLIKDDFNIKLSNQIAFYIEYETADYIKHTDYLQIKKYDDAYLAQRINNDSVVYGDFICEKLPFFIVDLVFVIVVLFYMFYTSWQLGLVFTLAVFLYILMYFFTNRILFTLTGKMFEAQASFFAMLSDQFGTVLLTKINSWYEEKNREFKKNTDFFYEKSIKYLRLDFLIKDGGAFWGRLLIIFALLLTSKLSKSDSVSVGTMTESIIYVELLVSHLNKANQFGEFFQKFKLAKTRLKELVSFNLAKNGIKKLQSISKIEIKNISFSVDGKKLTYPDITLQQGKCYVMKGENGSGKSTLINIMLGIIPAETGSVLYDENQIELINMEDLRRNCISVKNQEPYIKNGTLFDNIRCEFRNDIPEKYAAFVSELLQFSENRGGMDMKISHKNTNLSGGEMQKIAICRALCKDSDVLILDEPTNALDENTKQKLTDFLKQINDKIILIISHDSCFDSLADEIIIQEP